MDFTKVINLDDNIWLGRGTVFRFPAQYPYEKYVDFMVFDPIKRDRGMGLLVSLGHKGGLISVILPKDSENELNSKSNTKSRGAINAGWLKNNWKKWIYPECEIFDVYVSLEGYPVPQSLPD